MIYPTEISSAMDFGIFQLCISPTKYFQHSTLYLRQLSKTKRNQSRTVQARVLRERLGNSCWSTLIES